MWISITGGTIISPPSASPQLNLRVLPDSGGDYPTLHSNYNMLTLDINVLAVDTVTNELFRFRNTGAIAVDEEVGLLFEGKGKTTEFGEKDVRETITCNTSSEKFGWMNFATMVAQGRLLERDGGLGGIEFRVFRMVVR